MNQADKIRRGRLRLLIALVRAYEARCEVLAARQTLAQLRRRRRRR